MPCNINLCHQKLFKRGLFTAKAACWKAIRISISFAYVRQNSYSDWACCAPAHHQPKSLHALSTTLHCPTDTAVPLFAARGLLDYSTAFWRGEPEVVWSLHFSQTLLAFWFSFWAQNEFFPPPRALRLWHLFLIRTQFLVQLNETAGGELSITTLEINPQDAPIFSF